MKSEPADMDGLAHGGHLQLGHIDTQLLDGAGGADAAIGEEGHCLVLPIRRKPTQARSSARRSGPCVYSAVTKT